MSYKKCQTLYLYFIYIVFLLYICLSDSKSDDGGDFFDPGDDDDLDEVPDDVSIELS